MSKNTDLAYDGISESGKFREQYRFIFSIAVVAAALAFPDGDVLMTLLKSVVALSALFSGMYLILSAARVKYREPGRLYEVFWVRESFRMRMFDWSVHVFAAVFLCFMAAIATGFTDMLPGVNLGPIWSWVVVLGWMFLIGLTILFVTERMVPQTSNESLPKI